MVEAGWFMALPMNISDLPLTPEPYMAMRLPILSYLMSTKPMLRRRGSIAVLMNSLSSGSSSSSSVCGLGTLTSSISSSLQRSRESVASSRFLISASCMSPSLTLLRDLGAAEAEPFLGGRPHHQDDTD